MVMGGNFPNKNARPEMSCLALVSFLVLAKMENVQVYIASTAFSNIETSRQMPAFVFASFSILSQTDTLQMSSASV